MHAPAERLPRRVPAGPAAPHAHDPTRAATPRAWRWLGHAVAAGWIGMMLGLAEWRPDGYEALVQEDRVVEWATVALFATAGLLRLGPALRGRRPFDVLVALFCLFVAGEEISWGQRLVGYHSPEAFLAHNAQQEATLHNLELFGRPKWPLAIVLAGYGLLLPATAGIARLAGGRARVQRGVQRLLDGAGVSAPGIDVSPWFAAAVGLLVWYPVTFTGEWVEALAGALFLAASGSAGAALGAGGVAALTAVSFGVGLGMTRVSELVAARVAEPALVACARDEVRALSHDLTTGGAALPRLVEATSVHKRVWTSAGERYLEPARLASFGALAPCAHETADESARRRRFMADPWGTAYWLRLPRAADSDDSDHPAATVDDPLGAARPVVVYSFGADRRRDVGTTAGDPTSRARSAAGADIVAAGRLPLEPLP
jgi:hypothetical protein